MEVLYIPAQEINSDLGIVNAARVSLNKKSTYARIHTKNGSACRYTPSNVCSNAYHYHERLNDADIKLIHYLAKQNHWTPFAHARLYFSLEWLDAHDEITFYKNIHRGGFEWVQKKSCDTIKGSFYSWVNALPYIPLRAREYIADKLYTSYPVASQALNVVQEPFTYNTKCLDWSEEFLIGEREWKLATVTLLVKVPIFIARQIRTSQVGIAYSDLYVEGEAFTFNEVSRRYVNDEPEFYMIKHWRVREGRNVKQGSTGFADTLHQSTLNEVQSNCIAQASMTYNSYSEFASIAPEQLRTLLPQSMYTQFYMTATLHRWAQFLALRLDKHVQEETRDVALLIKDILRTQYPQWAKEYML